MTALDLRLLNLKDERQLRAWHAVFTASRQNEDPESEHQTYEQAVDRLRHPDSWAQQRNYIAYVGDEAVAIGWTWAPTNDNLSTCWLRPDVHPVHRRHGYGRALVERMEADLPTQRSELNCWFETPAEGWRDAPAVRFASRLGYAVHSHAVKRILPLPFNPGALPRVDVADYELRTHLDGVPDELRTGVGQLKGLIDVDSPSGDMEWEASPTSPQEYAEELAARARRGERTLETVALNSFGEPVAYTELIIGSPGRPVVQEGTLVRAGDRGHRLGMAIKVANLRTLAGLAPTNPHIVTENEETNQWMVAINCDLGFEARAVVPYVLKRRGVAAD